MRYRVWSCKIVIPEEEWLEQGADRPPRRAAIEAVEGMGCEVLACFSGWAGKLTDEEREFVDAIVARAKLKE